ncbi:MAG: thiamine phosphate synthase [Bacteroidota bacterium]
MIGRLHVLTDFYFQQRFTHAELARLAAAGGADTVQFRQKTGTLRNVSVEAERTLEACQDAGIPLLIDDHVDLAAGLGCAGVHVGQDDLPVALARRVLGPDGIVGATASSLAEAVAAEQAGASYIGFGPVYATRSKANPKSVKGLSGLRAVCKAVSIPVIAIAGITAERIPAVLEAGAHGVAVMTAVSLAPDPARAVADLLDRFN